MNESTNVGNICIKQYSIISPGEEKQSDVKPMIRNCSGMFYTLNN